MICNDLVAFSVWWHKKTARLLLKVSCYCEDRSKLSFPIVYRKLPKVLRMLFECYRSVIAWSTRLLGAAYDRSHTGTDHYQNTWTLISLTRQIKQTLFIIFRTLLATFFVIRGYGESPPIMKRTCGVEHAWENRSKSLESPYVPQIDDYLMKNAIQSEDKDAYNALFNRNIQCIERYLVPIAWHVIYDPQGRGNVSDAMLEEQVKVLNSKWWSHSLQFPTFKSSFCATLYINVC